MSNATLRTQLIGLTVSGVTRVFDHPPSSVAEADLPAMYPDAFGSQYEMPTYKGSLVGRTRTAELFVAVKATGMSTDDETVDERIAIADALEGQLKLDNLTGFRVLGFSVSATEVVIGGSSYAGLVATVEVKEG